MKPVSALRYADYPCPFGYLHIGHNGSAVCSVSLVDAPESWDPAPVSDLAADQFAAYFSGTRTSFNFPIMPLGTAFQQAVWHVLLSIPYGKTLTYGQVAQALGRPEAVRAVGMACNRNPIWIAIPCHRVVGAKGSLTGYAGGLAMKQTLLDLEQRI